MKCRSAAQLLLDYAEGALGTEAQAALEAHLDRCPACRRELEDLRAGFAIIEDIPAISPSPRFAALAMRRIRRATRRGLPARVAALFQRLPGGSRYGRLAWPAAAALLVAAGLAFYQYPARDAATAAVSEADWRDDEILIALDEALEEPVDDRLSPYTLWENSEGDGGNG